MPTFRHEGHRLAYTVYGDGPRTCVLVHGLLLSQKMHDPLARALAERGHRVVTLDLLGHGRSDRPRDMTLYSMSFFGEQMIALLDHLELDDAVLGGTSLGANATLEAAAHAPERVRGMVVEMPVLDGALVACGIAFLPPMLTLKYAEPAMRVVQAAARAVPRGLLGFLGDVVLDTVRGEVPSGVPPQRFYRTLVGHAIVWRPTGALEFTVGETAVLSQGSRTLDAAFLNPLMLYIVTQNDTGRESNRDNLTAFGAARVRLGPATFAGELLVDDIQIDKADRARTPDQLGWRLELTTRLPLLRPASATVEYRRLDSYTYMRGDYDAVYQHFDRPLGSELGPDADDLRAGGEIWATGRLSFAAALGRWRRGTLRVYQRPGQRATGNAGRPFPTTAPGQYVQSATTGDLSAQFLSSRIPLTASVGLARIENVNNTLAASALYVRARLTGSYAFRYP